MNQRRVAHDDEELADTAAMSADMLRSLANRWRFRIQAGRLGRHSMTESVRLGSEATPGHGATFHFTLEGRDDA